ncbi:hypothetical protein CH75_05850 [Dyella jiangningensis]|nr:hypothetical protein CH75_05850 [Dyella jiangningensis]
MGYSIEIIDGSGQALTAVVTMLELQSGEIEWRAVLWSKECPLRILEGLAPDAGAVEDQIRCMAYPSDSKR